LPFFADFAEDFFAAGLAAFFAVLAFFGSGFFAAGFGAGLAATFGGVVFGGAGVAACA
jgi:hypothetical protein